MLFLLIASLGSTLSLLFIGRMRIRLSPLSSTLAPEHADKETGGEEEEPHGEGGQQHRHEDERRRPAGRPPPLRLGVLRRHGQPQHEGAHGHDDAERDHQAAQRGEDDLARLQPIIPAG